MKKVIRIFSNIILFVIYSLISMNLVNFIYDLILKFSGNPVPPSDDPIHLKIAGITFFIIILFTLVFRKYFYLKLFKENIIEEKEEIIKTVSFEEIDKKVDEERENNVNKKKKKVKEKKIILKEGDMEIFMGKEIK